MPFADKVIHVTMSGKMLNGSEEWQTGFYVGKAEGPADEPTQAYADLIRNAWQTFFTTASSGIASSYTFEQVKLARLATDGKYDGSPVIVSYPAAAVVGASAGNSLPPQIALVATLIAGSGKGLAGKGRMYLPGIRFVVDTNGRISTADRNNVGTNLRTFFNALHGNFDQPGVPINASRGSAKFLGAGARNVPINGIRVGDIYDTQRRRRNGLSENYWVSPAIPA